MRMSALSLPRIPLGVISLRLKVGDCRVTIFVALIRAVNVGGTGKLPMSTLTSVCIEAGFASVRTYLASGNALFASALQESRVRAALETRLERHVGKPVTVMVRTAEEMSAVLAANPFKSSPPSSTVAVFLNESPTEKALMAATGRSREQVALGVREIYVAYGERMAHSKLRIPGAEAGTARNMNSVEKLAILARELGERD